MMTTSGYACWLLLLLVCLASKVAAFATTPSSLPRMFVFRADGTEHRSLLPDLDRSLAYISASYYEPQDPDVVELLKDTACHPDDACWALDACRGNLVTAKLHIVLAQQQQQACTNLDSLESVPIELFLKRRRMQQAGYAPSTRTSSPVRRKSMSPKRTKRKNMSSATKNNNTDTSLMIRLQRPFRKWMGPRRQLDEPGVKRRGLVHVALFLGLCRYIFGPQLLPLLAV